MPKTAKIESLEKKLEQIKAQLTTEKARAKTQERKDDTRRKILLGAYLLEKEAMAELTKKMDGFLKKPADRKLFGLAPLKTENRNDPKPDTEKTAG